MLEALRSKEVQRQRKSAKNEARACVYGFLIVCIVVIYIYQDRVLGKDMESARRQLLNRCDASLAFPFWLELTADSWPVIILYIAGILWMFTGMAIVCDEYFVPSLEVIADELGISEDVAGATLMAAGGSAPEFFTNLIGTFTRSKVGFGTVVGSAVFNILFVIGMCAIYAEEELKLTWWPLFRDICYYIIALSTLTVVFVGTSPYIIHWYEAVVLFSLYLGYISIMKNNVELHDWFMAKLKLPIGAPIEPVNFRDPKTFRAGILHLLIGEKSIWDTIPYRIITDIRGDLQETFAAFDKNKDGSIEKEEFEEMFDILGCNLTSAQINELFNTLDINKDKTIEFDEFSKWYIGSEQRIDLEMKELFDKYDYNKDGTITATALVDLIRAAGLDDEDEVNNAEVELINMGGLDKELLHETLHADEDAMKKMGTARKTMEEMQHAHSTSYEGLWVLHSMKTAEIRDDCVIWYDGTSSPITFDRDIVTLTFEDEEHRGLLGYRRKILTIQWFDGDTWQKRKNNAITFPVFKEWYQTQVFYEDKKTAAEDEAEHVATLKDLLSWPVDSGASGQFWWLFSIAFMLIFHFTIPDVRAYNRQSLKWAFLGFAMSIFWIGVFSICLVDWIAIIGAFLDIPEVVQGVTILAAGTSIPDLLSSVIVAKRGFGDMAVSSSVGSNIFDVLFCLPVPWFFYCVLPTGYSVVEVNAESLERSLIVLIIMILTVIAIIMYNDWVMTNVLGYMMFALYVVFLVQHCLLEEYGGC